MRFDRPVRVAVVGAGYFGAIHASKYAALHDVELAAIVDWHGDRAAALAGKFGARAHTRLDEVLPEVDALSVTVPARNHFQVARRALTAGRHVLVEKPMALDTAHADELIRLAERNGLILQVGFQERYVLGEIGLLTDGAKPVEIECRRAGPFTGRGTDVSVVLDLMIHDIDLALRLSRSAVTRVAAAGRSEKSAGADQVDAELLTKDGCRIHLHASRISPVRERVMHLAFPDGTIEVDFLARRVRNTTGRPLPGVRNGATNEKAFVDDPVGLGVHNFVDSVRTGRAPVIPGCDARAALDIALQIDRSAAAVEAA